MKRLVAKIFIMIMGVLASNRYFASEYRTLSEELALQQMTEASAQAMEQIVMYQNLIVIAPVALLMCGLVWMKNDVIDLMEELKNDEL